MPLQRRRSFDSTKADNSSPLSSRPESPTTNERSRQAPRIHFYDIKHHPSNVPFPRGGRHIGEQSTHHQQPVMTRRNDPADQARQTQDASLLSVQTPKDKKRHIFSRFGRKKSRTDLNASGQTAGVAHIVDGNSSTLSIASSGASMVSNHPRKRSKDYDQRSQATHSQEFVTMDDSRRTTQKSVATDNASAVGDRKRSISSVTSRKGKEREKSNGSLSFGTDDSCKEEIELDQNFGSLAGIVNPEYYNKQRKGPLGPSSILVSHKQDPSMSAETWTPPDSWAVKTSAVGDGSAGAPATVPDEEISEYDSDSIVEKERWDVTRKNFCIRIFRPDATFGTLQVPLNTTTSELIHRLAGKFFLHDLSKYSLTLTRRGLERALQPNERPVQIQKKILEQMGYTEQENLEDVGREDNSYLLRFTFGPNLTRTAQSVDLSNYQHLDLTEQNLTTIPIVLHQHASSIVSLDLSKNLQIEIPVDFIQACTNMRQLWLSGNEYTTLPASIRELKSLEHFNISSNRLRDLQHAGLENIEGLRTLRCLNNRLETLPKSFASFKYLTILFISNNSFTQFPEVICEITSLAYLDISFNKIVTFPDEIGNLVNLVGLFAIANKLTGSLPPSFAKLQKLRELDIRQNLITELNVIAQLPKLEIVFVDYNAISVVSFDFRNIRQFKMRKNHLTQLNLGFCLMHDTTMEPSAAVPSSPTIPTMLTELNLSSCKLTSLPDDLFLLTTSVETLILDDNALNTIPSSVGALRKLCTFSVQSNVLDAIPPQIFKLGELKELDVQKNNLKTLPKEIWMCPSLVSFNCSSNLLETFPEPYSTPGFPLQLPQSDITTSSAPAVNDGLATQFSHAAKAANVSVSSNGEKQQKFTLANDSTLLNSPGGLQAPPNFNPPSFFASPRNHPPPLSLSLRHLLLGDNRLTDDVWSPLSLFLELRTLNLSFNDLYEIPSEGLCHQHLYELYLSGNHLTSLPADDIEKLSYLRVLAVNGNKLQTLPAEIGKLRKLLVLDVGNNVLKYNINNWFYDWNWNWNLGLKYLNLSGNKRLEIKKNQPDTNNTKKNLSDFSALTRLRMLGLIDITILGVSVPEEFHDRRVRTSPSEVNCMSYGIADWLGPNEHLGAWDLVMPRFRNNDDECIFGLFDGRLNNKAGCKITKYLYDNLTYHFVHELVKSQNDDTIISALRRTFLVLEKEIGSNECHDKNAGVSAIVCYIAGNKLYVANVGDALAVISRNNGQAMEITQKHIPLNPSETSRIRAADGYVSNSGLLNAELPVSRGFGYFQFIPVVNANPYISLIDLTENEEFVIMASRGLWECMSYQTAVDIARTEKDDLMVAAQKLRDFAITYGAKDNIMVMIIGVGDLFDKRDKRFRNLRGVVAGRSGPGAESAGISLDETALGPTGIVVGKNKRRAKEETLGDSTLARLDREVPPPIDQVALVFTDIKSSTFLWETLCEDMRSANKIHDRIMRRTLRSLGGYEVKTEGDAFMVCFKNITAALLWCFTVQLQLLEADWPAGILETEEGREIEKDNVVIYRGLSVRMGIHWGTPVYERNPITNRMDYFGPVVNKASRICNAADGGQICVSSDVIAALRSIPGIFGDDTSSTTEELAAVATATGNYSIGRDIQQLRRLGFHVMELGERRLKGLETPEMLSLVYPKQLAGRMELDKSELMTKEAPAALQTPTLEEASPVSTPTPFDEELQEIPASSEVEDAFLTTELVPKPITAAARSIDPSFVCALSNLALRLECLTSRKTLRRTDTAGAVSYVYTPYGTVEFPNTASFKNPPITNVLDMHMKEQASDEELMVLMENFVSRVENAVSTLYLRKVGRFAKVLDKLGDAIELDPMHILRALQIYSDVAGMTENHS
ncbi:cysteinyl-tRNA synthetase [Apophysomyces ossiformis]|uniref:Adenylate cyclase n=1 Tax=Apophysomyces ossiformis TaxID=679940 RepID=A0A8H7BPZ8_9FUNG|nr:cysteinyl-tRNA synthetase [Apophysomyces ossiformis]